MSVGNENNVLYEIEFGIMRKEYNILIKFGCVWYGFVYYECLNKDSSYKYCFEKMMENCRKFINDKMLYFCFVFVVIIGVIILR